MVQTYICKAESLREKGEWQRVREKRNRKRQTENKMKQNRLQLFWNLDLKGQGYTAGSKYPWT